MHQCDSNNWTHTDRVEFKGGGEVVMEKFGRCAESLAKRDPAGSF